MLKRLRRPLVVRIFHWGGQGPSGPAADGLVSGRGTVSFRSAVRAGAAPSFGHPVAE